MKRTGPPLKRNNQKTIDDTTGQVVLLPEKGVIMRQTTLSAFNRDGFGAAQDDSFSVSLARA